MERWGIILAAGSARRFGQDKLAICVDGERLVDRAVRTATEVLDGVVLVARPGVRWSGPPVAEVVTGGARRSDSVRAGLGALPADVAVTVVHDAARPWATAALYRAVLAAVEAGADGAVPALPIDDTVKRVAGDRVVETLERGSLVRVQTPQAFRAEVLRRAHAGEPDATDDAALVEAVGGVVVTVPGEVANLKLTRPEDLTVARALRQAAGGEPG